MRGNKKNITAKIPADQSIISYKDTRYNKYPIQDFSTYLELAKASIETSFYYFIININKYFEKESNENDIEYIKNYSLKDNINVQDVSIHHQGMLRDKIDNLKETIIYILFINRLKKKPEDVYQFIKKLSSRTYEQSEHYTEIYDIKVDNKKITLLENITSNKIIENDLVFKDIYEYIDTIDKGIDFYKNIFKFIRHSRNYFSHSNHAEDKLNETFEEIVLHEKTYKEDKTSLFYKNIIKYDTDNILENYFNAHSMDVRFVIIILSLVLPRFIINYITDTIEFINPKVWKKILNSISSRNNDSINLDMSSFYRFPSKILTEKEQSDFKENRKDINIIENWDYVFISNARKYILPMLKVKHDIDMNDIQNIKKSNSIKFSLKTDDIKKKAQKYELSKTFIQHVLLKHIYDDISSLDSILELKLGEIKDIERNKDTYPYLSKLINFYKEWDTKKNRVRDKSWEEDAVIRQKVIKSLTRYIIFMYNHELDEKKDEESFNEYINIYEIIKPCLMKNCLYNKKINFSFIKDKCDENLYKILSEYNDKTIDDVYKKICESKLNKLGDRRDFIKKYLERKDELPVADKESDKKLWETIKRGKNGTKTNKKNVIIRPSLYIDTQKELWESIEEFVDIFKNNQKNNMGEKNVPNLSGFTPNIDHLIEILKKYKSLIPLKENKLQKQFHNKEAKKKYKEDKSKFFMALECVLLYVWYYKSLSSADKDRTNKLERLTLPTRNRQSLKENNIFFNFPNSNFYIRANSINYKIFFEKKIDNITIDTIKSWNIEKHYRYIDQQSFNKVNNIKKHLYQECYITFKKESIYVLDDNFMRLLMDYYIYSIRKIIEWENYFISKHLVIKQKNSGYTSFDDITKYINNEQFNKIKETRNDLFHFNLIPLDEIDKRINELLNTNWK